MSESSKYHYSTADWRGQLRKNNRKTRWVIFLFIALYLTVGLLVDLLFYVETTNASLALIINGILKGYLQYAMAN